MADVVVPDDVIEEAAKAIFENRHDLAWVNWDRAGALRESFIRHVRSASPIIARWARRQALQDARDKVRQVCELLRVNPFDGMPMLYEIDALLAETEGES